MSSSVLIRASKPQALAAILKQLRSISASICPEGVEIADTELPKFRLKTTSIHVDGVASLSLSDELLERFFSEHQKDFENVKLPRKLVRTEKAGIIDDIHHSLDMAFVCGEAEAPQRLRETTRLLAKEFGYTDICSISIDVQEVFYVTRLVKLLAYFDRFGDERVEADPERFFAFGMTIPPNPVEVLYYISVMFRLYPDLFAFPIARGLSVYVLTGAHGRVAGPSVAGGLFGILPGCPHPLVDSDRKLGDFALKQPQLFQDAGVEWVRFACQVVRNAISDYCDLGSPLNGAARIDARRTAIRAAFPKLLLSDASVLSGNVNAAARVTASFALLDKVAALLAAELSLAKSDEAKLFLALVGADGRQATERALEKFALESGNEALRRALTEGPSDAWSHFWDRFRDQAGAEEESLIATLREVRNSTHGSYARADVWMTELAVGKGVPVEINGIAWHVAIGILADLNSFVDYFRGRFPAP